MIPLPSQAVWDNCLSSMTTLWRSKRASLVVRAAALVAFHYANGRNKIKISNYKGIPNRTRVHCSVKDIHQCLGDGYFRCAYLMTYESFCILHSKLKGGICAAIAQSKPPKIGGRTGGRYKLPPVVNGPITTLVRLACWVCYGCCVSLYDVMVKYGIHTLIFLIVCGMSSQQLITAKNLIYLIFVS